MNPWTFQEVALLSPAWLVVVAVCLLLAWRRRSVRHSSSWRRVMVAPVLNFLSGELPATRGAPGAQPVRRIQPGWLVASVVALALAGPATKRSDAATWQHATGWIAVLDVSRSMTLADVLPSRLAAARDAVLALSRAAGARPLALVVYAGDAFLIAPPAFDHAQLRAYATLIEHGSVPIEGSNTARALSLAGSVVRDARLVSARVFLLGDGGGSNRAAFSAARHLSDAGHRLDVVQFGQPGNEAGPGGAVDVAALRRLADAGGGALLMSDAFGRIELGGLSLTGDTADIQGLQAVLWQDRSHWLLLALLPILPLLARRELA